MWYECVSLSACVLTARERQDLDWAPKVERRKPFQLVLKPQHLTAGFWACIKGWRK